MHVCKLSSRCANRFLSEWCFPIPMYHILRKMWKLTSHTLYYAWSTKRQNHLLLRTGKLQYMLQPIPLSTICIIASQWLSSHSSMWDMTLGNKWLIDTLSWSIVHIKVRYFDKSLHFTTFKFAFHTLSSSLPICIPLTIRMCTLNCHIYQ